jgi:porin
MILPHRARDRGVYASIEGDVPTIEGLSGWLRVGLANGDAQAVDSYLGSGLVLQGLLRGRPDDRIGMAVAHAGRSSRTVSTSKVRSAETSVEATYQYKVRNNFAIQPDAQYIIHPAAVAGARNAMIFGVRLVFTAGYPKKAPAAEATDPTVPPEGPQPTDDNGATGGSPQ